MFKSKNGLFFISFFLALFLIILFIRVIIGPFILAFLLSYLIDPVLFYFEKKHIRRSYSSFVIVIVFMLIIGFASWVLFPTLYNQILSMTKLLPDFKVYLENVLFPKIQKITSEVTGQKYYKSIKLHDIFSLNLSKYTNALLSQIGESTRFLASWLILIVITPILLFFLMRDLRKIYAFILSVVPFSVLPPFIDFMKEIDKKLKSVILGQLLVISVLCMLYSAFLFVAGLPSAIAVGVLTGIARFIPYLDTFVGSFLCFFVLVTNSADNKQILSACVAFLSVQCIDGLFITPRIMGKFSDLHPFLVILSVICFGSWFGFYGILLAIPVTAVGKVVLKTLFDSYKKSSFFYSK